MVLVPGHEWRGTMSTFTIDATQDSFVFGIKDKTGEHEFTAKYPTVAEITDMQNASKDIKDKGSEQQIQIMVEAISKFIDKQEEFKAICKSMNLRNLNKMLEKLVDELSGTEV